MEYAADACDRQISKSIGRAPPRIRKRINEIRASRGMDPILSPEELAAAMPIVMAAARTAAAAGVNGPGVWVNGPNGSLVPVNSSTVPPRPRTAPWKTSSDRTSARGGPRHGGRGPLVPCRVLVVPCGGVASSRSIRDYLDESVSPAAFGTADELNARGGFDLRHDHTGPRFAFAGARLRFVDGGTIGPILVWEPDLSVSWDLEAVRAIEAGFDQASVCMADMVRRTVDRPPFREQMVARARLEHVALMLKTGKTGAYPGARAMVFWNTWADDRDALKKQVARVTARSRWHTSRARYG